MADLSPERRDELAQHLRVRHFDGEGCGTYGVNACSICHGPSPMSAQDVADSLAPLIAGWLAAEREAGKHDLGRDLTRLYERAHEAGAAEVRATLVERITRDMEALPTTRTKAWDKGWDSIALADALTVVRAALNGGE